MTQKKTCTFKHCGIRAIYIAVGPQPETPPTTWWPIQCPTHLTCIAHAIILQDSGWQITRLDGTEMVEGELNGQKDKDK